MFEHAVILAAGKGERMRPLTDYVPKPLVKINQDLFLNQKMTIMDKAITCLPSVNADVYVTYGYKSEQIFERYKDYFSAFINTQYQDNAWFLFNSFIKHINAPIIVIPCDIEFCIQWTKVYDEFIKSNKMAMIIPVERLGTGDFITHENGLIKEISRKEMEFSDTKIIASGIQILKPNMISQYMNENNFYNVWRNLIQMGQLGISNIRPVKWKARDTLEDLK